MSERNIKQESYANIPVTFLYRSTDDFQIQLEDLQDQVSAIDGLSFVIIEIDKDPHYVETDDEKTPSIKVGPYQLVAPYSKQDLQVALNSALERARHLGEIHSDEYQKLKNQSMQFTFFDQLSLWFSKHYMLIINILVFFYVGIPFLAPVLMEFGQIRPAEIIYSVYSPLCHQLAYRSWFLFGEQAAYPMVLAHTGDLITYDQIIGHPYNFTNTIDFNQARAFIGGNVYGYKVALCERDVALWGSLFIFGLVYSIFKKRIKRIPWYLWLLIGVVPIAADGLSQFTELAGPLLSWLPVRESTPFLRTLTGALFGTMTGWYLFPLIEEAMVDTRQILGRKLAVLHQIKGK